MQFNLVRMNRCHSRAFSTIKMGNLLHQANEKPLISEPSTDSQCCNWGLFIAKRSYSKVLAKENSEHTEKGIEGSAPKADWQRFKKTRSHIILAKMPLLFFSLRLTVPKRVGLYKHNPTGLSCSDALSCEAWCSPAHILGIKLPPKHRGSVCFLAWSTPLH